MRSLPLPALCRTLQELLQADGKGQGQRTDNSSEQAFSVQKIGYNRIKTEFGHFAQTAFLDKTSLQTPSWYARHTVMG